MSKRLDRRLTDVELELMQLIWNLGECTIRDVFEALPKGRDLAYTTVATMVTRLLDDGDLSVEELKSLRKLLDERLRS